MIGFNMIAVQSLANLSAKKVTTSLLLFCFCVLCFVWPIENSNLPANRNLFIYVGLAMTLFLYWKKQGMPLAHNAKSRMPIYILAGLLIFTLLNGLLVAPDLKQMFRSWQGQYLRAGLLFFIGLLIYSFTASCFRGLSKTRFLSLVVLCSLGVIFIHVIQTAFMYLRNGYIDWGITWIVRTRTEMSFQINFICGILFAELLSRLFLHRKFLIFKTSLLLFFIAVCFVATALVNTRWGTIGLIGSTISICAFIAAKMLNRNNRKKMLLTGAAVALMVAAVGYASWTQDPRWQSLSQDAVSGWNLSVDNRCYDGFTGPTLQDNTGRVLDESNACRSTFFHQGWKLVFENPFGTGPRKDAFLVLLQKAYHDPSIKQDNSHYGVIDFALQNGFLGLAGWLCFVISLIVVGWDAFSKKLVMPGLFLSLMAVSFLFRSSVDNMLRDHFLEQFMAFTGLMIGLIVTKDKNSVPGSAS